MVTVVTERLVTKQHLQARALAERLLDIGSLELWPPHYHQPPSQRRDLRPISHGNLNS